MAATDQHYRTQKTLDIVFGVSCGALLLSTIWMFAADYLRPFKAVQRQFRDVEAALAEHDMVDKLPDSTLIVDLREELRAARENLKREQEKLKDEDRKIKAEREAADMEYRDKKATFDSQMSYYNIMVDDAGKYAPGTSENKSLLATAESQRQYLDKLEARMNQAKEKFDAVDLKWKENVGSKLEPLEKAVGDADDRLKKTTGVFDRYAKQAALKNWTFGDEFRNLPILDAFESPIKIKQLWLPDLTIDYSFKEVPRYDRCGTCHLGIERAAYTKEALVKLGDQKENDRLGGKLASAQQMLERREKAGEKLGFDPRDLPGERVASVSKLGLLMVLAAIVAALSLGGLERSARLGVQVLVAGLVLTLLSSAAIAWLAPRRPAVKTVKLSEAEVNQFCAHPRLDLFVDSNSPHPMQSFGCTICHAGQGSATDFPLAAHTPNDEKQEKEWTKDLGWEHSHFWDYPMLSKRFIESTCLKCHYQVTDLVRHGSKEEAPKLLRGFNLIKENGCFGCHEIQGVKSGRWVGPDLRLEAQPALDFLSAAEQERAKADPLAPPGGMRKVGPNLRRLAEKTNEAWARKWIQSPRSFRPDTKMPHFFGLSTNNRDFLKKYAPEQESFPDTEITSIAYYLFAESKAHLQGKDSYRQYLLTGRKGLNELQAALEKIPLGDKDYKELAEVSRRFYELALLSAPTASKGINADYHRQRQVHERLQELQTQAIQSAAAPPAAHRTEIAILVSEMNALTASLVRQARPVPIADRILGEDGAVVPLPEAKKGDAANGRRLFTERGCLACHAHEGTTKRSPGGAFNDAVVGEASFGPELSRIADKLGPEVKGTDAHRWLMQWLLNPNVYHPRTRMPITHLTPAMANDIAAWLLSQKTGWKGEEPAKPGIKELKALARVYLFKAPGLSRVDVDTFMPAEGNEMPGIPPDRIKQFQARDADELKLEAGKVTEDVLMWYIGKKAISRQGCFGCHDIPGFETAKPIGTGLNDWGKKDPDRIAYEDSEAFVRTHFNIVPTRTTRKQVEDKVLALWRKAADSSEDAVKASAHDFIKEHQKDVSAVVLADQTGPMEPATDNLDKADSDELERLKQQIKDQPRILELEAKDPDKLSRKEKRELDEKRMGKFFEPVKVEGEVREPFEGLFFEALEHGHRTRQGFLHLKLMEPRSYDYNRIKPWDDRLRMPQFKFARSRQRGGESAEAYQARLEVEEAEAREAVMTFILGLVADPIPLKYVHNPGREKKAEALGRQVLDKYNCIGCHQVRPGVYEFKAEDVLARLDQAHRAMSTQGDFFFPNHNAWVGATPGGDRLQALGVFDLVNTRKNDDSDEFKGLDAIRLADAFRFHGGDKALHDIRAASYLNLPRGKYQSWAPYGGTFTELLGAPRVSSDGERLVDSYLTRKSSTQYPEPRAHLPPPLHREGERVQPDWLYRFLLNPGVVRPEGYMLLRMPRFNMSNDEAQALVDYFAGAARNGNPGAGITYPYAAVEQREPEYWKHVASEYEARLKRAGPALAELKKELAAAQKAKKPDADRVAQLKTQVAYTEQAARFAKEQLALKPPKGAKVATDLYSRQAFGLLVNRETCLNCHNIGNVLVEGEAKGPNLILSAERLRPEWTEMWTANPARMFTYQPMMPQNFPNDPDPLKWKEQAVFVGSPLQQIRAMRDVLMDLPRLNDLLATQPPPPKAGSGGKK